jgi:hypothetical protein
VRDLAGFANRFFFAIIFIIREHAMQATEARELGRQVAVLLADNQVEAAYALLAPLLDQRMPFRLLDLVGGALGDCPVESSDAFLQTIAAGRSMGGWVVIASGLQPRLPGDLAGTLRRCHAYILQGDLWYVTDILGERVPGPALVQCFDPALRLLADWRFDPNPWVRRAVGVAIHLWTKRAHGDPAKLEQAGLLLDFLAPLLAERQVQAVKGVGWALKTMGKYYPDLLASWLAEQLSRPGLAPTRLMLRKALTYLPPARRRQVLEPPA